MEEYRLQDLPITFEKPKDLDMVYYEDEICSECGIEKEEKKQKRLWFVGVREITLQEGSGYIWIE